MDYLTISTRTTDYPSVGKKMKLGSYFIPHTKIYSIWIKRLMKIKQIFRLYVILLWPLVENKFLNNTQKAQL